MKDGLIHGKRYMAKSNPLVSISKVNKFVSKVVEDVDQLGVEGDRTDGSLKHCGQQQQSL